MPSQARWLASILLSRRCLNSDTLHKTGGKVESAPLCRSDDLTPGARFQKLVSQRKSPEIPMLARHGRIKPIKQKQESLVPIGEAFGGLNGMVTLIREASTHRRCATSPRPTRLNQLVGAS